MNARRAIAITTLVFAGTTGGTAQEVRVAAWAGADAVTASADWTQAGLQLGWRGAGGTAVWAAAERVGRFGTHDALARGGAGLHPSTRLWLTLEAATARHPDIVPRNSWAVDAVVRVAPRTSVGLGYRRQNYAAGAVDLVIPHATIEGRRAQWTGQLYLSRNPSQRTDVAGLLRVALPVGPRASAWLGAGAGRESYLVGAPPAQQVRSLETITVTAGARWLWSKRTTFRIDATTVHSEPVLSRTGVTLSVEQRL